MLLRVQSERLAGMKIRLQDYIEKYQMTAARVRLASKDAIVMHPGPIIRGLELTADVADATNSVIVDEVRKRRADTDGDSGASRGKDEMRQPQSTRTDSALRTPTFHFDAERSGGRRNLLMACSITAVGINPGDWLQRTTEKE